MDYLIDSGAVPSYDADVGVLESEVQANYDNLLLRDTGPIGSAQVQTSMPNTGGRPDIGPLPTWAVYYLVTMDPRAEASLLANANAAGSPRRPIISVGSLRWRPTGTVRKGW